MTSAAAAIAIEDAVLVEQTRQGDVSAFARLVSKYQDRVFNTCCRVCGHAEDARDLTQEAFLQAFKAIDTFGQRSGFYTWLFRIAVNLSISHRRRNRHGIRLSLHDADDGEYVGGQAAGLLRHPRGGGSTDNPSGPMQERETREAVMAALESLEDEFRAVIVLRDIEGFDYRQIAEILDVPPGTVKSRLHRARMALREKLAPVIGAG